MPHKAIRVWASRWQVEIDDINRLLEWVGSRIASSTAETSWKIGLGSQEFASFSPQESAEALLKFRRANLRYLQQEVTRLDILGERPGELAKLKARAELMRDEILDQEKRMEVGVEPSP